MCCYVIYAQTCSSLQRLLTAMTSCISALKYRKHLNVEQTTILRLWEKAAFLVASTKAKTKNVKKNQHSHQWAGCLSLSLSIIFNVLPSLEAPTYSAEWSAGTGSLRKIGQVNVLNRLNSERCKTNTLGNDQWHGLFKHTNFDSYPRCPTAEHVTSQCFCLSMYCHTRSLAPFLFFTEGEPINFQ